MPTEFTITQNLSDGKTALFVDESTGVTFSGVKAIRLVIGYFPYFINPQTLVNPQVMDQWREYKNIVLTAYTYDNKVVPVSGLFVPFISGIVVQSGDKMQTTGNYSPFIAPSTYLPTANYTPLVRTPADFGVPDINGAYPDGVYSATYEQYGDNSPGTPTTLVLGTQYIVFGTGATCTFDGNIYREGEVFTAGSNNAVSFTGGGTIKILIGNRFQYFCFTYFIQKKLADIQYYLQQNCICNEELQYELNQIDNILTSVQFSQIQVLTNPQLSQDMIENFNQRLDNIYTQLGI